MLARELRMCYATIALVTDMDAGAEASEEVDQAEVFALFAENIERLKAMLAGVVADLPDPAGCSCDTWADGLELTYDAAREGPAHRRGRLHRLRDRPRAGRRRATRWCGST